MAELHPSARRKLTRLNVVCWSLFFFVLLLPAGFLLRYQAQSGGFRRVPDVQFVYFYSMGRLFDRYPASQVYDPQLQREVCTDVRQSEKPYGPIAYAPFLGILLRPFSRLPFLAALLSWSALSFALYLTALFLTTRSFFPGRVIERSLAFWFALSIETFWMILGSGHLSMLGLFCFSLAFYAQFRKQPLWSGLALSGCLYKPTLLVLFLPMLFVTRRYKTLAGFLAGAIALAGLTTVIEGPAIWPGYLHTLFSFGSMAANRSAHVGIVQSAFTTMDLVSFFSILPGGTSWAGRALLCGVSATAAASLVFAWWKSVTLPKQMHPLLWAATLTWTLLLNVYVPSYDTVLVVLSLIVTAGALKQLGKQRLHRQFAVLCVLILVFSWVTVPIAQRSGIQVMTLLLVMLGTLQLVVLRKSSIAVRAQQDAPLVPQAVRMEAIA